MKCWNNELINKVLLLIKEGKNSKEISVIIKRSRQSVIRKINRLGYYFGKNKNVDNTKKYKKYDWLDIQKKYDDGFSYIDLVNVLKLSPQTIAWAKKNNLLKFRTISDGIKKSRELGRGNKGCSQGIIKYRQLCDFKFNVYEYPDEFDLKLLEQNGWYKAKNKGNNLNGVSRDHKYSIKDGFINNINPLILSHPSNCELIVHKDNQKKNSKSKITIEELIKNIDEFNIKYKLKPLNYET
jgi:hypothetical protein